MQRWPNSATQTRAVRPGVCADVAEDPQVDKAVTDLAGQLGGLDALVTCAGIEGEMGAACEDVTAKSFREVLDVNVVGTFLAVKYALPYLKSPWAAA